MGRNIGILEGISWGSGELTMGLEIMGHCVWAS